MIFKKSYSFLIVPHHGQHGKSAHLSSRALNAAFVALAAGLLVSGILAARHYRYHFKLVTAYEPTFRENERLTVERRGYDRTVDSLGRVIGALNAQVTRERSIYATSMNGMAFQVENVKKALTKVKIQAGFKGTNVVDESEPAGGPGESVTLGKFDLSRPIEPGPYEARLRPEIRANLAELDQVDRFLSTKESLVAATPELAPLFGRMTSNFGIRRWRRSGHSENHQGLDIAVPRGTPVHAPGEGVVTHAARMGDYGNMVELDHGTGYTTRFGHLSQIDVEVGDRVLKGQIIGLVGSTGRSTGPHLHYEVRMNGTPVNPIDYLGSIE
ncbi:M23 family metallopeptidase [bacterium]|nr:M23 family metallopeptidase [bacterium]